MSQKYSSISCTAYAHNSLICPMSPNNRQNIVYLKYFIIGLIISFWTYRMSKIIISLDGTSRTVIPTNLILLS